ncbi:MAG: HD domain-containing phosphohydrolase [Burkholderiaceae bacterium]
MKRIESAQPSFVQLRDRLKARTDELDHASDVDLVEAQRYLLGLPDSAHTADSVDTLIHLARNFFFDAQPAEALQGASIAARLASLLNQRLSLCDARGIEGLALSDLGRFTEATVAHAESWKLARELENVEREGWAIKRVGDLWAAMGQLDAAIVYLSRSRQLATAHVLPDLELASRNNLANCAVQLKDPEAGLRALLPLPSVELPTRRNMTRHANAHDTLGHLYLLAGDLQNARAHACESGRFAHLAGVERTTQRHEALLGLIDVRLGAVERGLAAVERALAFARCVDHTDVVDCLGMCADAHEEAGQSDKALDYLKELVEWKKRSIHAEIMPLQYEGLAEPLQLQTSASAFDATLLLRSQRLQANVQQRIQHLVETAINAEVASGHDLNRTFRVAKLSRCLATVIGWDEERVGALTLGGQLCNIGMMAIPARILQKRRGLSNSELDVMRTHTQHGAELLRKSKLKILDVAAMLAEQHHERFNGSGYPRGLSGDAIAEEARVVSICDAFDAMTHRRPWRPSPLSIQVALSELKQGAGSQFDPSLVNAFVDLVRREFWEHDDFDAFLAEGASENEYVRVRARMEALIADGS